MLIGFPEYQRVTIRAPSHIPSETPPIARTTRREAIGGADEGVVDLASRKTAPGAMFPGRWARESSAIHTTSW